MKETRLLVVFLIAVYMVLIGLVVIWVPTLREKREFELKLIDRMRKYDEVHNQLQTLQREIHELEHDKFAVEKIAREKFRMSKENEIVIIYTEE